MHQDQTAKEREERAVALLVYGNVDDCRTAARHENDPTVLGAALAAARELREGKCKVAILERRIRELTATRGSRP